MEVTLGDPETHSAVRRVSGTVGIIRRVRRRNRRAASRQVFNDAVGRVKEALKQDGFGI